jgi:purine-nucleoside phosphorylase
MKDEKEKMDLSEGTPHIKPEAPIAPVVLMPGDPLRAEYIAKRFLSGARRFNKVRGMLGFTGEWQGLPVSVMGSGMGIPSMGIYSWELFSYFGVESIIRVGTCAGYSDRTELGDIILSQASSTTSSWASQYELGGSFSAIPDFSLLEAAVAAARRQGRRFLVGNTLCLDVFSKYHRVPRVWEPWVAMGIVGSDMEAYSLYCNAASLGRKALAMFTVSDHRGKDLHMSVEEREVALDAIIEVALETASSEAAK